MKNKKEIIIVCIFLTLGLIFIFYVNSIFKNKLAYINSKKPPSNNQILNNNRILKHTKEVDIEISDDKIIPEIINIKMGEVVKFNVKVTEGYHVFKIENHDGTLGIATNKSSFLIFPATRSGQFKIYTKTERNLVSPEGKILIN